MMLSPTPAWQRGRPGRTHRLPHAGRGSHGPYARRAPLFVGGALVLVALVVVLLPLAYASPPDSSWINGLYDDADGDDAIVVVTSGDAASDGPEADVAPMMVLRRGSARRLAAPLS
jgi:hypothetical protein